MPAEPPGRRCPAQDVCAGPGLREQSRQVTADDVGEGPDRALATLARSDERHDRHLVHAERLDLLESLRALVFRPRQREQIDETIREQLIVELYSK